MKLSEELERYYNDGDKHLAFCIAMAKDLEDDEERLNWIERNNGACGHSPVLYGDCLFYAHPEAMADKYCGGKTIREAIDCAIKTYKTEE